jgi:hypothetical protein
MEVSKAILDSFLAVDTPAMLDGTVEDRGVDTGPARIRMVDWIVAYIRISIGLHRIAGMRNGITLGPSPERGVHPSSANLVETAAGH